MFTITDMHRNTAVGLLLVSTVASVFGQTSSVRNDAAQFSADVLSLLAIPSVVSFGFWVIDRTCRRLTSAQQECSHRG